MKITAETVEAIAKNTHENYFLNQIAAGAVVGSLPALYPWEELSEEMREANRAHARGVLDFLDHIGASLTPIPAFSPDVLEQLAMTIHLQWCATKRAQGWTYGPVRDDTAKKHPSLVTWSELSEAEKQKDRDTVVELPTVLAMAGLLITYKESV